MRAPFETPPDAVRVWRGYRAPALSQADFFARLGTVFVPATVKMQAAIGLAGYLPSVPAGLAGKPDSVPDETAILFWESQATYAAGFDTLAVRTYTLTHGAVYRPPSGANFPTLFNGMLESETPVFLINKPADWMEGPVRHLIGCRAADNAPDSFRRRVGEALSAIQARGAARGAIACAGDDYLAYWQTGPAVPGDFDGLTATLGWHRVIDCAPAAIGAGLWDAWPGMTIAPGDGFNMQFPRRGKP